MLNVLPIEPFSPKEVVGVLARTNLRKAPGYDLIWGKSAQTANKES
jgi:hypothetical protein